MNGLYRTGEFTYYDELGVDPKASPEEIRDAFRSLVRLLHPDQQTDPHLKQIAERLMRKLNPIYSILSDPERRRHYNEDLANGCAPPIAIDATPRTHLRRYLGRTAWFTAMLVSAGLLTWLASEGSPATQTVPRTEARPDFSFPSGITDTFPDHSEVSQLQSELENVLTQRDAALNELKQLQVGTQAAEARSQGPDQVLNRVTAPVMTMTELPSLARVPAPPAPARIDLPPSKLYLTGFWFYVKPRQGQKNENETLYPPEFIEATIAESNGVVHGKYRARFRIVDRPISPDVNFTFSGVPAGSAIACAWTGPGGAKGELNLRLTSDNSLRIDWTASELGSQQGLISGTSVLTRRLD